MGGTDKNARPGAAPVLPRFRERGRSAVRRSRAGGSRPVLSIVAWLGLQGTFRGPRAGTPPGHGIPSSAPWAGRGTALGRWKKLCFGNEYSVLRQSNGLCTWAGPLLLLVVFPVPGLGLCCVSLASAPPFVVSPLPSCCVFYPVRMLCLLRNGSGFLSHFFSTAALA